MNLYKSIEIAGVTFYYLPSEITMTDELIEELSKYANVADEHVYTIYYDEEILVVY